METKKKNNEIETWRGVHRALIQAVKCAEEAIAAQRAQKRYWLEEICANLDDDGGHQVTSVWKRAHAIVKKSGTTAKRSTTLLNSGSSNNSGGKLKKKPAAKRAKQPHENELDAQKPMKNPRKRKAKDSPEKKSSTVIKKIQQNQYISSKVSKPPSPERLVNEDDEDDDEQDEEEPEEEIEVEVEAEVEEEQVEGDEDSVEEESIEDESVSNSATVSSQPHVSDYSARQEQVESPYLHPHPQPGVVHSQKAPQWGSGTANLHMMASVAFGANPAGYPHQMMSRPQHAQQQQNNPCYGHHPQHREVHPHQTHDPHIAAHYPSHGVRTYTSLEDVGASDDDSDEDKF